LTAAGKKSEASASLGLSGQGGEVTVSGNVNVTLKLGAGVTLPNVNGTQVTLGDFKATLTDSDNNQKTVAFTDSGTGTFAASFLSLLPGGYTLSLEGPAGMTFTTSPPSPQTVTIGQGGDANVDFTITVATSP
jgi:hypothetical protein